MNNNKRHRVTISFKMIISTIVLFYVFFALSFHANAEAYFTGQKKAACEAIMCLSTGSPPHECDDSLHKYFKIVVKNSLGVLNPRKTLKARKSFLRLCPKADEKKIDEVNTVEQRDDDQSNTRTPHEYDRDHLDRDHDDFR